METKSSFPSHIAPELLYLIIEHLAGGDLCTAALVCKTWNTIATSIIWSTSSIDAEVIWKVLFEVGAGHPAFTPLELPENSEKLIERNWPRLRDLAKMIRSINVLSPFGLALLDRLSHLLASTDTPLLCPHVSDFGVDTSYAELAIGTSILLGGASIRELRLAVYETAPWEETLSRLRLLPEDRFRPEELIVRSTYNLDALSCVEVFPGFIHFTYGGRLSKESWILLGTSCPQLQTLFLESTNIGSVVSMVLNEEGYAGDELLVTFPSLQELSLEDCNYDQTRLFVSLASKMPKLVSLITCFIWVPLTAQDTNLNVARHYRQHSPSLETLSIAYHAQWHFLGLIPEYGSLKHITLWNLDPKRYPTNDEIGTFAQSLPNLINLILLVDPGLETSDFDIYGVSLEVVIGFATSCKNLEELSLAVNAENENIHCPFHYRGPTFPSLKSIELHPFVTLDICAEGIAHFLRAMAPALSECAFTFIWIADDEEDLKEEYVGGKGFTEEEWDSLFQQSKLVWEALTNIILGKPHASPFQRGSLESAAVDM